MLQKKSSHLLSAIAVQFFEMHLGNFDQKVFLLFHLWTFVKNVKIIKFIHEIFVFEWGKIAILTQHFTFQLMFGCEKKFQFFPPNNKNFPFIRCIQFILWCNVKNSISLEVAKGNFVSIFHWIWNLLKVCNFRFREWHAFYPIGANWIFASQSSLKIE